MGNVSLKFVSLRLFHLFRTPFSRRKGSHENTKVYVLESLVHCLHLGCYNLRGLRTPQAHLRSTWRIKRFPC